MHGHRGPQPAPGGFRQGILSDPTDPPLGSGLLLVDDAPDRAPFAPGEWAGEPVQFAVGQRELENGTVAIRRLGSKKQQVMPLSEAILALTSEVDGQGQSD